MENSVIDMKEIHKSYFLGNNELEVLKGFDLKIKKGEFVSILGPSGSGKSTLMNIIGLIDIKSKGEYYLDDLNIEELSEDNLAIIRNQKIGFIFQKFNLLGKFTALHNVELPLILRGQTKKEASDKAKDLLNKVGLEDRIFHKPIELSKKPRILSILMESQAGIKIIAFISKYMYNSYRTYVR